MHWLDKQESLGREAVNSGDSSSRMPLLKKVRDKMVST